MKIRYTTVRHIVQLQQDSLCVLFEN